MNRNMARIGMYLPFTLPRRRTAHSLLTYLPSISKRRRFGQKAEEAPHPGYDSDKEMGGKTTPRSTIRTEIQYGGQRNERTNKI